MNGCELAKVQQVTEECAHRLWRLAYAAPAHVEPLDDAHAEVGAVIEAALHADSLNPKYFPHRPTLLPQLLEAVDDPRAAAERISRIIAHDPVLAAAVLRFANSSRYRSRREPIETIQRAIVVLGVDVLRALAASAMLRPAFRATRRNFPRFPRMLWQRTELAVRMADLIAVTLKPQERFEAQLAVLLSALGPLTVYSAAVDCYAVYRQLAPSSSMCAALTSSLGKPMAVRIARDWHASDKLQQAIEGAPGEPLTSAVILGELIATVQLLKSQAIISCHEKRELLAQADVPQAIVDRLLGEV